MDIDKMVLTYPRLSAAELDKLLSFPGVHVEICADGQHPEGSSKGKGGDVAAWLDILERAGTDRVVLSSDGGMADAPSTPELQAWALDRLRAVGVGDQVLRALVHDNPTRLVGGFL